MKPPQSGSAGQLPRQRESTTGNEATFLGVSPWVPLMNPLMIGILKGRSDHIQHRFQPLIDFIIGEMQHSQAAVAQVSITTGPFFWCL